MRKHHYRIVNPVRFFLFVIISVLILVFAGYSLMSFATAEAAAVDTYATIVVQENDNLWDLASEYNPDRNDIRSIVYEIYDINDIGQGEMLHPGQKILIPVY